MKIPIAYNVRSVMQRPVSTSFTAVGIALVVAVFIAMLALANGFIAALARTGSTDNVMVLRRGADSELTSGVTRADASLLASFPHVAAGSDGRALVSPEVYVLVGMPRVAGDSSAMANVVVRGISERAWDVRANVRLTDGRRPLSGRPEICVGVRMVGRVPGTAIGQSIRFGGRDWAVVCHFAAAGSAFESEIWGENEQFMPVFRGEVFQSVTMRLRDPAGFDEARRAIEADRRLTVDVYRESDFYMQQSELLGTILRILAIIITSIMAVGAIFGAVNTMYAAVSDRTPEIAVLLTLGFHPRSILASFLVESAFIAALGGALGCLIALPANGIVASTTNWVSFSEMSFAFRVTPSLLAVGFAFSVVMGVVGGFFPALRAARLPIAQAIR
jgi:hypothetical protein